MLRDPPIEDRHAGSAGCDLREADRLRIIPCMPDDWKTYSLDYRYGDTVYRIAVVQTPIWDGATGSRTTLDGVDKRDQGIALVDDRREHLVEVRINRARSLAMASAHEPMLPLLQQRADGDR